MQSLLIDSSYNVVSVVGWKKAAKLMAKGKACAAEETKIFYPIGMLNDIFLIPSVLKLNYSVSWKSYGAKIGFSRRNLYRRDKGICQYCGKLTGKSATVDHIIPKSRGGKTDYKNCVICCPQCNIAKKDRTPKEAGMILLNYPRNLTFVEYCKSLTQDSNEEWQKFLG